MSAGGTYGDEGCIPIDNILVGPIPQIFFAHFAIFRSKVGSDLCPRAPAAHRWSRVATGHPAGLESERGVLRDFRLLSREVESNLFPDFVRNARDRPFALQVVAGDETSVATTEEEEVEEAESRLETSPCFGSEHEAGGADREAVRESRSCRAHSRRELNRRRWMKSLERAVRDQ